MVQYVFSIEKCRHCHSILLWKKILNTMRVVFWVDGINPNKCTRMKLIFMKWMTLRRKSFLSLGLADDCLLWDWTIPYSDFKQIAVFYFFHISPPFLSPVLDCVILFQWHREGTVKNLFLKVEWLLMVLFVIHLRSVLLCPVCG